MKFIVRFIIGFLLIFLLISLSKNVIDYQNQLSFYNDYKTKYEAEKKRNLTLKTELLQKTDPNEIEKIIRNKLNLSKAGETTIILPPPTPTPTPLITPAYQPWQQWIRVFFKP